jgi:hypothetical protein
MKIGPFLLPHFFWNFLDRCVLKNLGSKICGRSSTYARAPLAAAGETTVGE